MWNQCSANAREKSTYVAEQSIRIGERGRLDKHGWGKSQRNGHFWSTLSTHAECDQKLLTNVQLYHFWPFVCGFLRCRNIGTCVTWCALRVLSTNFFLSLWAVVCFLFDGKNLCFACCGCSLLVADNFAVKTFFFAVVGDMRHYMSAYLLRTRRTCVADSVIVYYHITPNNNAHIKHKKMLERKSQRFRWATGKPNDGEKQKYT